jgi:archaellum biogenesis protein FlaJ (TadC family)
MILTPEQEKSRRARNIAIALAVSAFMLLFYVVTIVKLGGAVARPPI